MGQQNQPNVSNHVSRLAIANENLGHICQENKEVMTFLIRIANEKKTHIWQDLIKEVVWAITIVSIKTKNYF